MTNKTLRLTSALAFVALLATSIPSVLAQSTPADSGASVNAQTGAGSCSAGGGKRHHGKHGHKHGGRHGGGAWKQISSTLTPDQKVKIDGIKTQLKADSAPLVEQMKSLRSQLQTTPAPANADALKTQLTTLRQQVKGNFKAGREKMMAVLTDEQRAQLAASRKNHKRGNGAPVAPGTDAPAPTVTQ